MDEWIDCNFRYIKNSNLKFYDACRLKPDLIINRCDEHKCIFIRVLKALNPVANS